MKRAYIPLILLFLFSTTAIFADNSKKELDETMCREEILFFHGKRMVSHHELFRVVLIVMHGRVLMVRFNMPVDPRTVSMQSILINGMPLPAETVVRFNKTGALVEIRFIKQFSSPFTLDVSKVTAFDGSALTLSSFTGISDGTKRKFPEHHDDEKEECDD
jgi:hypothetical protein